MPISWSDAVADADNADDHARYERAVAQAMDLDPLVKSFADAIRANGWPTTYEEESRSTSYDTIRTRYGEERHLSVSWDGSWAALVAPPPGRLAARLLVRVYAGQPVQFGNHQSEAAALSGEDFDSLMAAMDETKDWVPRELVAYLRAHGIAIPHDP